MQRPPLNCKTHVHLFDATAVQENMHASTGRCASTVARFCLLKLNKSLHQFGLSLQNLHQFGLSLKKLCENSVGLHASHSS